MDDRAETTWITEMLAVRDARDKEAFARLFRHFAPRVKAYLMRSGASGSSAEECAQEVMTTLWRKAHLFDASRATVATWIFAIARNRLIDTVRRERRPEPEELPWGPEAEPPQAEVVAFQDECRRLSRAVARLPARQKAVIEAAYFGDLTQSEIAAKTGLPLGTIKSRLRLALERLRHEMRDEK